MRRWTKSCAVVTTLALSCVTFAAARADEPREVYATIRVPVAATTAPATRGGEMPATPMVVLPSDIEVLTMARKSGARMTRGGLVMPKTKLRQSPLDAAAINAMPTTTELNEQEKMMETGKPETPASTRGQTAYAYIFIKPENVAGLGHIGWGYWAPNMNYYVCGSTENPATSNPLSSVYIAPGWNNGYWSAAFYTEAEMFNKFKQMGYYAFKRTMVSNPNPNLAWSRACYTRDNGFRGIGWNCLDHTYYVLEGYGVTGMPWKQTNPAPNGWFNAFSATGYRLP